MRVISRIKKAKNICKTYGDHYKSGRYGNDKIEILNNLLRLSDDERTPDTVDKIIGNSRWTECMCDECGSHTEAVMEVGEANMCLGCLCMALETLKNEN